MLGRGLAASVQRRQDRGSVGLLEGPKLRQVTTVTNEAPRALAESVQHAAEADSTAARANSPRAVPPGQAHPEKNATVFRLQRGREGYPSSQKYAPSVTLLFCSF